MNHSDNSKKTNVFWRSRAAIVIVMALALAFAHFSSFAATIAPKNLLVYYGWPSSINGCAGNVECAAQHFAHFDRVILGPRLAFANHPDYTKTLNILRKAQQLNPSIQFIGSISLARPLSCQGEVDTDYNRPIHELTRYNARQIHCLVQAWANMNQATGDMPPILTGIFLDDFGFDVFYDMVQQPFSSAAEQQARDQQFANEVGHIRLLQNYAIDVAHDTRLFGLTQGLFVVAHAEHVQNVFSTMYKSLPAQTDVPPFFHRDEAHRLGQLLPTNRCQDCIRLAQTRLGQRQGLKDYYFYQGFQINEGAYIQPSTEWLPKVKWLHYYRSHQPQVGVMAVTTSRLAMRPEVKQDKYDYAWFSAAMNGFDAMGWGEPGFSDVSSEVPTLEQPHPQIGQRFISEIQFDGQDYTRQTDKGVLMVNTYLHKATFKPYRVHFGKQDPQQLRHDEHVHHHPASSSLSD